MKDLAGLVGLNQGHFARAFKQTTGLAPYQYVLGQRIERACRLLEGGRVPIVEISERCGFGSEETLRRSFTRLLAATPQDYRARFSG